MRYNDAMEPPRRKYDPHEVLRLWQELGSQTLVAQRLGCRQGVVSNILRNDCGIHVGKGQNQPRPDPAIVLNAFRRLGTQKAAAQSLGLPQTTVSRILRRDFGIHVGKGGRPPVHPLPMTEVASRYLAGESCAQIAETYGVTGEVIRRRLRGQGVTRRSNAKATGPRNCQWKGGRSDTMHYHRRQSYEIAAICLGQPLPRGLVIHHADEDPTNNRPENLLLFDTQSAHVRFHQQLLRFQRRGEAVDAFQLALDCGAKPLPSPPRPIVFPADTEG